MKSDIEIAQEAELVHIKEVAEKLGINEDELEFYGKYKAKISDELWESVKDREDGKLVLVTAINPTPAGEGKTTTSIGLGEAMALLGKKAVLALREPSLGPCFGIKGGAAGGGYAQVVPMEDLNYETIQGYRNRHRILKPGHPFERLNDAEYLRSIGAAAISREDRQLHPTAAGMLMFGDEYNIVRHFPEYFLDYREMLDPTIRWTDRIQSSSGEWSGN